MYCTNNVKIKKDRIEDPMFNKISKELKVVTVKHRTALLDKFRELSLYMINKPVLLGNLTKPDLRALYKSYISNGLPKTQKAFEEAVQPNEHRLFKCYIAGDSTGIFYDNDYIKIKEVEENSKEHKEKFPEAEDFQFVSKRFNPGTLTFFTCGDTIYTFLPIEKVKEVLKDYSIVGVATEEDQAEPSKSKSL